MNYLDSLLQRGASSLPNFTGWGGSIPAWQGVHASAPRLSNSDMQAMAQQIAGRMYGGSPDQGQIDSILKRLQNEYDTAINNTYSGSLVRRELSDQDIANRVGDMRESYGFDPNYIRAMLPDGYEDAVRKDAYYGPLNSAYNGIMNEGVSETNNYSLGPVDELNYMFLGSRSARPEDNPNSAVYKANKAIQLLGGPAPTYGDPNNPGLTSYVVPTQMELDEADFFANRAAGSQALDSADNWARRQADLKMEGEYANLQRLAEDQFTTWVNMNRSNPEVVSRFGAWGVGDALGYNDRVGEYFRANQTDPFVTGAINPDMARGLADPGRNLTDPSWGMMGQAGREAIRNDTPDLFAMRAENSIRQQQAYDSIGDGQWGGVLNTQQYSNPNYRQITGQAQQPTGFSSFGNLGGLGGMGGTPTYGQNNPFAGGATFNPNPFGASNENRSQSPWGGPWGGW